MSNPKVILLQGQFKFSPKLTNAQLNDNYHYTDFDLSINTITCNSFLKIFRNEDVAFRDVKHIIQSKDAGNAQNMQGFVSRNPKNFSPAGFLLKKLMFIFSVIILLKKSIIFIIKINIFLNFY